MTIQANIKEFYDALDAVKNHCMAARVELGAGKVTITYPEGDFEVGGLRVDQNAVMLRRAIAIMERHWLSSFPGAVAARD